MEDLQQAAPVREAPLRLGQRSSTVMGKSSCLSPTLGLGDRVRGLGVRGAADLPSSLLLLSCDASLPATACPSHLQHTGSFTAPSNTHFLELD